jgi:hypothetical protein
VSWWFFNEYDATHGNIVCDCRGRLPGLPATDDFMPGSYIASIICDGEDFSSPVDVRRKVSSALERAAGGGTGQAQKEETAAGGLGARVANLTNWSSSYYHLELPGCHHIVHFPVVSSEQDIFYSNLYLFRPRAGELAALLFDGRDGSGRSAGPLKPWY